MRVKDLQILSLYKSKMFIELEQEILSLSYSELEYYIDLFNSSKEFDLAQMLFDRKLVV